MLRIMHTPVGTMECSPQAQDEDGTSRDDQDNFTNRYAIHIRNARSKFLHAVSGLEVYRDSAYDLDNAGVVISCY
jgi:hypothetical protein